MGNKVRVFCGDLQIGMYVSELDRPWVETPFLFQGFTVENDQDIHDLREHCEYVYVDAEKSRPDLIERIRASAKPAEESLTSKIKRVTAPLRFTESNFRHSLVKSYAVYKDARGWIDIMLEDSRLGRSIDTETARDLVTRLADQVIQNPDALVWLTHLKSRDEYTATHCINVCILALTFGRCLGLEEQALNQLGLGALLHDLGKMRVPNAILNKPGRLTKDEFEVIMKHPVAGHAMLKDDKHLDDASLHIVLHHHERLDGEGYPRGLSEAEIPLLTRISSIVDVYDAITSDRCYHDGVAPAVGLENLFKWARGNFDVALLEGFIKCLGIYPIGSVVRLNSGEVGIVVATDADRRLKPIVLAVKSPEGKVYQPRRLVNLSSAIWEQTGKPLSIAEVLHPGAFGLDIKRILQDELQLSTEQVSTYRP